MSQATQIVPLVQLEPSSALTPSTHQSAVSRPSSTVDGPNNTFDSGTIVTANASAGTSGQPDGSNAQALPQPTASPAVDHTVGTLQQDTSQGGQQGILRQCWEHAKAVCVLGGLVLAAVALWPSVSGEKDGHQSTAYAEWTAKKDFIEFCANQVTAVQSPNCSMALNMSLPPPPHFLDHLTHGLGKRFALFHGMASARNENAAGEGNVTTALDSSLYSGQATSLIIVAMILITATVWRWMWHVKNNALPQDVHVHHLVPLTQYATTTAIHYVEETIRKRIHRSAHAEKRREDSLTETEMQQDDNPLSGVLIENTTQPTLEELLAGVAEDLRDHLVLDNDDDLPEDETSEHLTIDPSPDSYDNIWRKTEVLRNSSVGSVDESSKSNSNGVALGDLPQRNPEDPMYYYPGKVPKTMPKMPNDTEKHDASFGLEDDSHVDNEPYILRHVPKFDRTILDACQDQLYNPISTTSVPVSTSSQQMPNPSLLSPAYRKVQERLQAAHNARSQSPTSATSRAVSPFRQGSPHAPTNDSFGPPALTAP